MLKNESGCPCTGASSAVSDTASAYECTKCCGGTGDCRDTMPLAYVYAPDQKFEMLYSADEALAHGTLFEELYKPMEVYGRE